MPKQTFIVEFETKGYRVNEPIRAEEIETKLKSGDYTLSVRGVGQSSGWIPPNLDRLRLPHRILNPLRRAGITTIEQLDNLTDREILSKRGIGKKSLTAIRAAPMKGE